MDDIDAGIGPSDGSPTVGDADPMTGTGGLRFTYPSQPTLPGSAGGEYEAFITHAELHLENVRTLSDATNTDDPRTLQPNVTMDWMGASEEIVYTEAPPGTYTFVQGRIAYFLIAGQVRIGDSGYDFRIEENQRFVNLMIQFAPINLDIGQFETIDVQVNLGQVVSGMDWRAIRGGGDDDDDDDNKMLIVDSASPFMDQVRADISNMFQLVGNSVQ